MEVKQIYTIVNNVTNEVLGKTDLVLEDLSNIVDIGTEVFNGTSVDNYVKSLVNHIGKVIFVDRPYSDKNPCGTFLPVVSWNRSNTNKLSISSGAALRIAFSTSAYGTDSGRTRARSLCTAGKLLTGRKFAVLAAVAPITPSAIHTVVFIPAAFFSTPLISRIT